MSLSQLQEAMTLLIRLPDHHRDDGGDAFLSTFALSPRELADAKALAADPRLAKYGRSLRDVRYERALRALPIAQEYIDDDTLDFIYCELYEPQAALIPLQKLGRTFIEFLLEGAEARDLLTNNAEPFVFDLLRFERAELMLNIARFESPSPLADGSRLQHRSFATLVLDYDIPAFLQALMAGDEEAMPDERAVNALIVSRKEGEGWRYFEIDRTTRDFLEAQLAGRKAALPLSYGDLVELGICRSLDD